MSSYVESLDLNFDQNKWKGLPNIELRRILIEEFLKFPPKIPYTDLGKTLSLIESEVKCIILVVTYT